MNTTKTRTHETTEIPQPQPQPQQTVMVWDQEVPVLLSQDVFNPEPEQMVIISDRLLGILVHNANKCDLAAAIYNIKSHLENSRDIPELLEILKNELSFYSEMNNVNNHIQNSVK